MWIFYLSSPVWYSEYIFSQPSASWFLYLKRAVSAMFDIANNMFPATCCRLQSAASLHLCWARNVKELMRPAATSWQANEFTLLGLPLWLSSNCSTSSFVIFPFLCASFLVYLLMWVCASQCHHHRKRLTRAQREILTAWERLRSSTGILSASSWMWQQDCGCPTSHLMPNRLALDP